MKLANPRRLASSPAVTMTASVMLVAVSGYVYLALAGRLSSSRDAAAMASLYVLVNMIGQGIFVGLEQETSRSLSHALATGADPAPAVRRAVRHTVGLLVICLVLTGVTAPLLVSGPLHGEWRILPTVFIGTVSAGISYLVRGLLGGSQLFKGYSVALAAEGLSRLIPCVAIAATGLSSAFVYCLVHACGLFSSAAAGLYWLRPLVRGMRGARGLTTVHSTAAAAESASPATAPSRLGHFLSAGLMLLVGAGLLNQLVANLPALGASSRLSQAPATATAFVQAATLSRIPLLLVGPVTALLLPRLTSAGALGDLAAVRRTVRLGTMAMLGLGGLSGVGLAALGPWVLRVFFAATGISALSLVLMSLGTAGLMAVGVLQPALVGVQRQRMVPIAFGVGSLVMVAAVLWPGDPVGAAVAASLLGPLAVAAAMGFGLRGLSSGPVLGGPAAEGGLPAAPFPAGASALSRAGE